MENPFGTCLARKIEERGVTILAVADRIDVSPSTISALIRGIYKPSSTTCRKLAEYFKVDPDIVLEMGGHRSSKTVEELPDFHIYISRKFKGNHKLQRALEMAYEALTSIEEERQEKREKRRRATEPKRED